MLILTHITSIAVIAVPAVAATLLGIRDDTPTYCSGLPDGSSGTLPYNLTLAAYRTDQSNPANIPLYLAPVPSTSQEGGDFVIAVLPPSAFPSNDFPSFNLSNGILSPIPAPGVTQIIPWDVPLQPGDPFDFVQTVGTPDPVSIFCAADESADYPVLSLNNNVDGFSICASINDFNLEIVVYEPVTGSVFYTYDTCYPVRIYILPYTT